MESRRFVIEAVMAAIYGQLLVPGMPVHYFIPYTSVMELYELRDSPEQVMEDPEDDLYVKQKIKELIQFCEQPLNRKKIQRALQMPWKVSAPLIVNSEVCLVIVNAHDQEQYGESFDPIETELILVSAREKIPVLTDQNEFTLKVIEYGIPIQVFDLEDYDYALEAEG